MSRRRFLHASATTLAGTTLGLNPVRASTSSGSSPDVVVVGAGTFGAWTAYHLTQLGARVTLLDAYGPGNARSSSGGETRQIQTDPREPELARSAVRSYELWNALQERSGQKLVLETGRLGLFPVTEGVERPAELAAAFGQYGLKAETLTPDELRYRWPQLRSAEIAWALHSSGAAGSLIMARRAIQAVVRTFQEEGGRFDIAKASPVMNAAGAVDHVKTHSGESIRAQHYVFACGPWLRTLFPQLLGKRLQVQRRDVLFFGSPPGDTRFAVPNLPSWGVYRAGYYGFPDVEGRGFKVAPNPDLNAIEPDTDDRLVSGYQVQRGRRFLKRFFPDLASMPVTETRVCQVTDTIDGDFIADRHPEVDNLWILGGGSGHGFKHGPALGEFAAQRVLGQEVDPAFVRKYHLLKEEFAAT